MPRGGGYRGGDSVTVHREHLREALKQDEYEWESHEYRVIVGDLGSFVFYYLQSILLSIWHLESGQIYHIPLLYEQDTVAYNRHQIKFERSAQALREKG